MCIITAQLAGGRGVILSEGGRVVRKHSVGLEETDLNSILSERERIAQSGWHLPSHNAQHVETLVPTQLTVEVSEVIYRC